MAGRMPGTLLSEPVHFLDLALISQGLAVLLSLRKCDNDIATKGPKSPATLRGHLSSIPHPALLVVPPRTFKASRPLQRVYLLSYASKGATFDDSIGSYSAQGQSRNEPVLAMVW
ncbi:hypothetical protein MMC22_007104 [Lobaria immixta]|nr:hypothetical protein [Lobaria immixta]